MIKSLFYFVAFVCIFSMNSVEAQKRKFNESRLKFDPQLEALWYEDGQGNEIIADDDYEIEVGANLELIIQANKDADGELANIDMEEEACTYQLISDDYQLKNGFINDIVLNGDSIDTKNPNRKLDNLTRLKFIGIEETNQCLDAYEQALITREKNKWCKKRSWPIRNSSKSKIQLCR